ncbi:hypothetical protein [Haladaptatus sp. DJG-WS-42]|uniref:hypothetical protein n=1 Tax=Haladaptatus sp. DJG-WS-42 TaxID=3120516 RepID=UPI0030D5C692
MQSRWKKMIIIAFILGGLVVWIPSLFVDQSFISPSEPLGEFTLGLVQLVALFLPVLVILIQILLDYSHRRQQKKGLSGGVGVLGPQEFRWFIFTIGGISSILLTMGLVTLFLSLNLPGPIEIAASFILFGILLAPGTLILMSYLTFIDGNY